MFALNGRLNAEDAANLEVEVAQATMNVARTLYCNDITQDDLADPALADLAVTVRVTRVGTWGDVLFEQSMQVGKAFDVLADERS